MKGYGVREIAERTTMGLHKIRTLTRTKPVRIRAGTTLAEAERLLIVQALEAANQNYTFAAELLGVNPKTVYNRLHKRLPAEP